MASRLRKIRARRRWRRLVGLPHLVRSERGTQLVELAIVLPIFVVFFGAAAEFGRYFYEYTTLAKAARPFTGGTAVGQWRPTPPAFGAMSAQGLAFTAMFVLESNIQFEPGPPRGLTSATYTDDSTPSRRSVATPDRRALRTRRRWRCSGKATPASIGIRRRTRLRGPTICPCPRATGSSRS